MEKKIFFYQTELGKIGIVEEGDAITALYFQGDHAPLDAVVHETELLKEAGEQLGRYLSGGRRDFMLPLAPAGTAFMQRVWQNICAIPYGETRSYQEIAERAGNQKASRAVGLASNRNPIPIFIPCHRMIGADGKLTGYRGGLQVKAHLLELERPD